MCLIKTITDINDSRMRTVFSPVCLCVCHFPAWYPKNRCS